MERKLDKRLFLRAAELCLVLGTIIVALYILKGMADTGVGPGTPGVEKLEGWYYFADGKRIEVELPETIETDGTLILYNDSLTGEDAGKTVTTQGAQYQLQIVLGDQVLYEYEDDTFQRNNQMKAKLYCDAQLPGQLRGETLELHYERSPRGKCRIAEVYIGTDGNVVQQHLRSSAVPMGIVFFMVVLGIVAVATSFYLRHINMPEPRFMNTGGFLLLCAVWCVTDSPMAQMHEEIAPALCLISFYVFMLLAVPMLHFLQNTGNMRRHRVLQLSIDVFYANAILQGILNYCGAFSFVRMLPVTHVLLAFAVVVSLVLLIREYRELKEWEVRTILLAFAMLGVSGVLALILYWAFEISFYGVIFETGILFFVCLLLRGIIITMARNIRYKTELMVYKRLAWEDHLTGMKNRGAFEEYLKGLERTAESYRDIALIFMDLNNLKRINDNFGHNAGDEVIIAAAACIKNTFSGEGECYRIGGDEFCVILPNPSRTQQEWFACLDGEIRQYNSSGRYNLSVARGISYLRRADGTMKSISDWKYEADLNMYENKGRKLRRSELILQAEECTDEY